MGTEPASAGRFAMRGSNGMTVIRVISTFVGAALMLCACGDFGRKTTLPSSPSQPAPTQQPPVPGQAPLKLPPL